MARKKVDPAVKRAIKEVRKLVEDIRAKDGNEAQTRRRIERVFTQVMGYDEFDHLTREFAIKGAGETEHVDFAIKIESDPDAKPVILVEIKRVGINLSSKHLRQASSYAIDHGCDWALLTNGKEWQLHHVEFGKPPTTTLIQKWDFLDDDINSVAGKFDLICYQNVKRGELDKLWDVTKAMQGANLLSAILSEESLSVIRRQLRKTTGVFAAPEEVVRGIRKMLNEAALAEMGKLQFTFPSSPKKRGRKPGRRAKEAPESPSQNETESEIDTDSGSEADHDE